MQKYQFLMIFNNFNILKAVTVFPEPDSPTKATVSPFGILNEIEFTTFKELSCEKKPILKFFISTKVFMSFNECFSWIQSITNCFTNKYKKTKH